MVICTINDQPLGLYDSSRSGNSVREDNIELPGCALMATPKALLTLHRNQCGESIYIYPQLLTWRPSNNWQAWCSTKMMYVIPLGQSVHDQCWICWWLHLKVKSVDKLKSACDDTSPYSCKPVTSIAQHLVARSCHYHFLITLKRVAEDCWWGLLKSKSMETMVLGFNAITFIWKAISSDMN